MPNTLQIKRGLQINLPTGLAGELLYTSDTKRLYIGDGATNNLLQGPFDRPIPSDKIKLARSSELKLDESELISILQVKGQGTVLKCIHNLVRAN